MRRHFLASLCGCALGVATPLRAETHGAFPSRPLRLLVPLPAGGPSDFIARAVAEQMGSLLGQRVVVENKPGADGLIAAREVAAAAADGYTVLYSPGSMLASSLLSRGPGLDWSRDLAPLGRVARVNFALAVHPDVPAATVADLVAHAKQRPGTLNVATSTPSEVMAMARFMRATGTQFTRVPYKGGTQALPDLLAGRVQVMFGPVALLLPHMRAGTVRILAQLTPQRSSGLPSVPTMSEAGLPEVTVPTWQALYAPAALAPDIKARLAAAVSSAMQDPNLKTELEKRVLSVDTAGPGELAEQIAREMREWQQLAQDFKLAAE